MTPSLVEWGTPADRAELAVLSVHGRGQDPAFMQATAARLGPAPVRFFAPEAEGNTWYPRSFLEPIEGNQPALDHALETVNACFGRLSQAGFDSGRVVLWGFSQGACLLSHLVLTMPRPLAGLVLFTGGYLGTAPHRRRTACADYRPCCEPSKTTRGFPRTGSRKRPSCCGKPARRWICA